ncbi:MAG: ABC transporter permease [Archaeoglobaceae archaeon]|nr:ABC transporter permease [Archaeoglobales archaeon]
MFGFIQKRDLILTLTKYEFKLRYRGAALGVLWSLLAPFLLALVLYFVFRNIFAFVENFAIYVLVGVFVFRFFSVATSVGINSILGKSHLITKTNLNREFLPFATTISYAISSFIELLILIPIVLFLGAKIGFWLLFLPFLHVIYTIFVYGLNLLLSATMVYFRDLNQIWEVLTNVLFFASPIVYPISVIPEELRQIYMLNPITAIIELYRGVMIYNSIEISFLIYAIASSFLMFLAGYTAFKKLQTRFGEIL